MSISHCRLKIKDLLEIDFQSLKSSFVKIKWRFIIYLMIRVSDSNAPRDAITNTFIPNVVLHARAISR